MKFILTDYQEEATSQIIKALVKANRDYTEDDEYAAISLTAPTGAGKTVIASSVVEQLFKGNSTYEANRDATVLWLTDNPSLNEQTRRKMMDASGGGLGSKHLITIDESFDQRVFDKQRVYFLNTQKLGAKTQWVKSRVDNRKWSVWETISNTINERGGNFIIIIDEAHRGTGSPEKARPTILRKIIAGEDSTKPAAPIVWGISATPERFDKTMEMATTPARTQRHIKVDPQRVRESGLLKDALDIRHPNEEQNSVNTLTRLAARELREMTKQWAEYADSEDEPLIEPVLVVQVPAKRDKEEESTWLDREVKPILETLEDEWGELQGGAIAHAFDTHQALTLLGGRTIRYVPPEEIQDRTQIRVVLFKEALTTGWDCPRAEVMLSFRKATDFTYIAQLVGRMVRTPLARRINTDERLNEVTLVLPHYDEETVGKVVDHLKSDPEAPPIDPKVNPVSLPRNTALPQEVFDKLLSLPTYTVPGVVHRSQVARLNALAVRLSGDDIEPDAVSTATNTLISTLNAERTRLGSALDDTVKGLGVIDVMGVKYKLADETSTATPTQVTVDLQDVESLFTDAKRKLRDGLAHDYWSYLLELEDAKPEDERMTPEDVKLVVCALANDPATVNTAEVSAENLIQTWLKQHSRDIANLRDSARAAYSQIRATAKNPELDSLSLPDAISVSSKKDATEIERHIFADSNHKYPTVFKSSWEKDVVDAELAAGAVAWYQNPVGGGRAIRVAYKEGKRYRALYPDFVFFDKDDNGELRASIVDPHDYTRSDTGPKWRALADYAAEHASDFHRVDAVIKDGDKLLRIDLLDEPTRDALQAAGDSKDAILDVFKQFGGDFVANLAP